MTEEKTAKKPTPESTKRFRLAVAALKNVEDAEDNQVRGAIGEFQSFMELYVAQRMREVEAREPIPFTIPNQGKTQGSWSNRLTEASDGSSSGYIPLAEENKPATQARGIQPSGAVSGPHK